MRYRYYTADVFTDHIFGGNQLVVFPAASGLETRQMQQVAREFGYSETVFVFPPDNPNHTRRLRIFTPSAELPFAGHPTLGAAHVLAASGEIPLAGEVTNVVFEEGIGPIKVSLRAKAAKPVFAQLSAAQLPEIGPTPPESSEIASVLSLAESDLLLGDNPPQALSCGVPFLFVPLRTLAAIRRIRLNRDKWETLLACFWAPSLYVFTYEVERSHSAIHARMFAPGLGVAEDPATGAAAAALAGYIAARATNQSATLRWVIEQGFEMGRPSLLEIEADKVETAITAVRVGGSSVLVCQGEMDIPTLME